MKTTSKQQAAHPKGPLLSILSINRGLCPQRMNNENLLSVESSLSSEGGRLPRAKSICSVVTGTSKCLNANPCPTHKRKPWQGSARNIRRPSNWRRIRDSVIRRDGFKCVQCGANGPLEVDHILSVAKGGSWEPTNLQTLCRDCHSIKSANDRRT